MYEEKSSYNNEDIISSNNSSDLISSDETKNNEIYAGGNNSKPSVVKSVLDSYDIPNINNRYSFCCLCGKYDFEHDEQRHFFFAAFDEHRCITCNKWFFQHKGMKNPCWVPKRYIEL